MNSPVILMLPIEAVVVKPDRQRSLDPSVEKHIAELRSDIKTDGLLHAISVTEGNVLRTGWCRLQAVAGLASSYKYASTDVAPGFIPAVMLHHTDETTLFRVELMENLRRKALSPVDQAKAVAALHRMLKTEHGDSWTKEQTGEELNKLRGTPTLEQKQEAGEAIASSPAAEREVADSLLIESFVNDADVQKASSRGEAVRLAKKKLEAALMESAGALAQPNLHTDFNVVHGDCKELLPTISSDSFAGIICDPPYGVDADTFGEQTSAEGHEYADTHDVFLEVTGVILREGFRVCRPGAHLYMFCDPRKWSHLATVAEIEGWNVYATPLIWHKPGLGHAPQPGYFSRRYECILFAQKGNDRRLQRTRSDVFEFSGVKDKLHAAEKPVELLRELMTLSFFPGERILDPCCGRGTSFVAGFQAKIQVSGIELSEKWFNISKQTIGELK